MALKSFINPSRLAISWFNSSVLVLGASRCISSAEWATCAPFCKRFMVGGCRLRFCFLNGDKFIVPLATTPPAATLFSIVCGRIVTVGMGWDLIVWPGNRIPLVMPWPLLGTTPEKLFSVPMAANCVRLGPSKHIPGAYVTDELLLKVEWKRTRRKIDLLAN